jgi:hypothetical protein
VLTFLTKTGIDVKYSTGTIEWFKNELPLCDPHDLKDMDFKAMAEIIEIQQEVDFFGMDWYDPTCFAIEILDAKYEKVQIEDAVNPLEHLSTQQKADLKQVLSEFTKLFDGTLGVFPHKKFHIDLEPGAKPRHARPWGRLYVHCLRLYQYKLYTFFHVFCRSLVLILPVPRVPEVQGGSFFFRLEDLFSAVVLRTNWYITICILHVQIYAKLYVTNLY